jgi:cytochrome P450
MLAEWTQARRAQPRTDVMTRAAEAVDAGLLSADEAAATLLHFIIAGNGTTTALIGNTLFALLSHGDQLAEIVADPDLISAAIEESLRWEAPLPRDRRIAAADTVLDGAEIKAGDRVYAVLAAANRDPRHFSDPDSFDVHRQFDSKHHTAFGRGIHFCLGAPLARLETAIAIRTLLDRYPSARLVDDFAPEWHEIATHRGLVSLPIEVDSGR